MDSNVHTKRTSSICDNTSAAINLSPSGYAQADNPASAKYVSDMLPLDMILPLIEDGWEDDLYAQGADDDSRYKILSEREYQIRQMLTLCTDPVYNHELEEELAKIENELCQLSQKYD